MIPTGVSTATYPISTIQESADKVKILNLSLGQDTGGQQMMLSRAWSKHPGDEYTSVTTTHTFYQIQNKYHPYRLEHEWWPNADIVHINNELKNLERFRHMRLAPKPLLVHHHGTSYRTNPDWHHALQDKYAATAIVSTIDLQTIAPDRTQWLPQVANLDELSTYRQHSDDGILKVAHAPTNRPIKSTNALIAAVTELQKEGMAISLDVIEKVSNVECMKRKGRADVFVDQLLLGYGNNAIEAWGMGIPVIAGVDPERCPSLIRQSIPMDTRDVMLATWGSIPFYEATEQSLKAALVAMADKKLRATWAKKGMAHITRFHEQGVVADKLRAIYQETIDRGPAKAMVPVPAAYTRARAPAIRYRSMAPGRRG